jgi:hypothetical protein
MKKIPMRRCVVSGESLPKKELLRIVKTPEGVLKVDPSGKLNGHGAYIKKSLEVLELAIKKKTLAKMFAMEINESLYEDIRRYL